MDENALTFTAELFAKTAIEKRAWLPFALPLGALAGGVGGDIATTPVVGEEKKNERRRKLRNILIGAGIGTAGVGAGYGASRLLDQLAQEVRSKPDMPVPKAPHGVDPRTVWRGVWQGGLTGGGGFAGLTAALGLPWWALNAKREALTQLGTPSTPGALAQEKNVGALADLARAYGYKGGPEEHPGDLIKFLRDKIQNVRDPASITGKSTNAIVQSKRILADKGLLPESWKSMFMAEPLRIAHNVQGAGLRGGSLAGAEATRLGSLGKFGLKWGLVAALLGGLYGGGRKLTSELAKATEK